MRPGSFILMTVATVAGGTVLFRKLKLNVPGFH